MVHSKEDTEILSQLKAQGIDPVQEPHLAVARLTEMRGRGELSDLALVDALEQLAVPAAVPVLERIASAAHGQTRRRAKQALFRLRQRMPAEAGLSAAAEQTGAAEETSSTDRLEKRSEANPEAGKLEGLISGFDPVGVRIVWLIKPILQGGVRRLSALVSYRSGMLMAYLERLSRREIRQERQNLELRLQTRLVEADWRLTDFILCEAFRETSEADRVKVGHFLERRAELLAAPVPEEIVHPVYAELNVSEELQPSPSLLDHPLMEAFLPTRDEVSAFVAESEAIEHSPLILSRAQQLERFEQVVDKALVHLLEGPRASRARRYLEDAAYYMARIGQTEYARSAAAAALLLRQNADVRRVAFFRRWVEKALVAALEDKARTELENPRLVLTPAEAMRAGRSRKR